MRGAFLPHHHIRLRSCIKEDLRMWIGFLRDFNGVKMLVEDEDWVWHIQIFSDALDMCLALIMTSLMPNLVFSGRDSVVWRREQMFRRRSYLGSCGK
ncbi:hypothetical protein NDU88_004912 [Pleurodeles waltl]|uniref:Uncharacterized protein n=1 Tax=Pleurodeles waltl TaxID=8319 RepID=A0AAV7VIH2_PLEWA|nr:hypothetical protein NDU88_004912 [Pleurodeles waltl]